MSRRLSKGSSGKKAPITAASTEGMEKYSDIRKNGILSWGEGGKEADRTERYKTGATAKY